jgi:ribosomal protein S18 acetylase RimI-like enzyme
MNGHLLSPSSIRPATPVDIPALVALVNDAFAIEEFLEGTRTDAHDMAAQMNKGCILLLSDADGRPLASVYTEQRGAHGYMGMLAVAPKVQGSGLARRLVEAAEDRFRSAGLVAIEISVLSLRPELLPLYRRFGFVETGVEPFLHPRTFKDGAAKAACHCIVMTKQI